MNRIAIDSERMAEQLTISMQAEQNFSEVVKLFNGIADPPFKIRERARLRISRELVSSGREPLAYPRYFLELFSAIRPLRPWYEFDEDIALLEAGTGDVDSAVQRVEPISSLSARFISDFTKVLAAQGVDVQPLFDRIYTGLRVDSIGDAHQIGLIAKAQCELGLTAPKEHFDRFKYYRRGSRQQLNDQRLRLATSYALAGYPEDAFEIWRKVSHDGFHHRAEVLSAIAIAQAKNNVNPSGLVTTAIDLAEMIQPKLPNYRESSQVSIYANLVQALSLFNLDTQSLTAKALQIARLINDNSRADSYIEIAEAELIGNRDARLILKLALDWVDHIVEPGAEEGSGYAGAIQLVTWIDTFHAQLKGEYFEDAYNTLQRLDRYSEQDVQIQKAESIANLAKTRARKGLSVDEIDNLSAEEIRAILIGNSEEAKQAVLYFGLDKKVI